jgi:hypothetical protein
MARWTVRHARHLRVVSGRHTQASTRLYCGFKVLVTSYFILFYFVLHSRARWGTEPYVALVTSHTANS